MIGHSSLSLSLTLLNHLIKFSNTSGKFILSTCWVMKLIAARLLSLFHHNGRMKNYLNVIIRSNLNQTHDYWINSQMLSHCAMTVSISNDGLPPALFCFRLTVCPSWGWNCQHAKNLKSSYKRLQFFMLCK